MALKTITVDLADMARSMMVTVCSRSADKRGVARDWERA